MYDYFGTLNIFYPHIIQKKVRMMLYFFDFPDNSLLLELAFDNVMLKNSERIDN